MTSHMEHCSFEDLIDFALTECTNFSDLFSKGKKWELEGNGHLRPFEGLSPTGHQKSYIAPLTFTRPPCHINNERSLICKGRPGQF